MNNKYFSPPLGQNAPIAEILLAETAIRIELPPSKHKLAVERYEAIRNHIERADSPLFEKVGFFYPQGSMAIGATINSYLRSEGYDIDIVAELLFPLDTEPSVALDTLFEAIRGQRGSRYYDMVERQTRCVTVYYEDGMHLDVTPSILLSETDPRMSWIFHAKPELTPSSHLRVITNSWGFCDWYQLNTPVDVLFEEAYAKRAQDFDSLRVLMEADVKPVPAHSTQIRGKSSATVAQQLLKRNRNIRYAARKGGRMPPSVLIARFAGDSTLPGSSIAGALDGISLALLNALETAELGGQLIDVRNPKCHDDRFTDRWPENREAQRVFIADLKHFRTQLAQLLSTNLTLDQKRDLLVAMFGQGPAQSAIDEYAATIGKAIQTGMRSIANTGRVLPVSSVAAPAVISTAAAQAPKHTFYGTKWRKS